MRTAEATQIAKVVPVIDHGNNVQLLCVDERGLLSVYFQNQSFSSFQRLVQKAGLTMVGLMIEFNNEMVRMLRAGKYSKFCPTRE